MITVIVFILILALLVLSHEFGHFIIARWRGMRVFEFGFGLPPKIFGVYKDPTTGKFKWVLGRVNSTKAEHAASSDGNFPATVYSLNLLPIGGFCKIKGEEGDNAGDSDSFMFCKAWERALVLVAGVSMNVVLAAVLLTLGFMVGLPTDMSAGVDVKAIIVEDTKVMVQYVDKNSPAEQTGIKYGDRIISLNNEEMKSSAQMIDYVKSHNQKAIEVKVERGGKELSYNIIPNIIKEGEVGARLGVVLADAGIIRYPWYIALYKGVVATGIGIVNIVVAFCLLIKNLIVGNGLLFDVSGPVGIAMMVGQSARLGLSYLINLTAMLSLTLAVINILPIPALDGGRLLFIGFEKIFRRQMPMKYEQLAHTIGFVLLLGLIAIITWRDVAGLF